MGSVNPQVSGLDKLVSDRCHCLLFLALHCDSESQRTSSDSSVSAPMWLPDMEVLFELVVYGSGYDLTYLHQLDIAWSVML